MTLTTLETLRNRALALLTKYADKTTPVSIDYEIDSYLRQQLKLPARPPNTPPYKTWMVAASPQTETVRTTSQKGIDLIKRWEGYRSKAYLCPSNVWTIGYGHTARVRPGDRVTRLQAEHLLRRDLVRFEEAVRESVKVPLNQNQFDALVSFCYNVGTNAFSKSTLVRLLNRKQYSAVANQLSRWTRANGRVLPGLVSRRLDEAELFNA